MDSQEQVIYPTTTQKVMFALARKATQHSDCKYLHGSSTALGKELFTASNIMAVPHTKLRKLKTPQYWSLHSEIALLLRMPEELRDGANIYNYREDRHGLIADSKPCATCQLVLHQYGISTVFYTTRQTPNYRKLKL